MNAKKEIRKSILEKRDKLTKAEHEQKSQTITELVVSSKQFQNSDIYLLFVSYKSEVDTTGIIRYALETGKTVYLPKVLGTEMEFYQIKSLEDLKEGYRGICEPEVNPSLQFVPQKNKNIFVLMPGAVFDMAGGRIGYGGGFYDKFLKRLEIEIPKENLCKMAVAFECQMIEEGAILREEHDIAPDYIVTEKTLYITQTKDTNGVMHIIESLKKNIESTEADIVHRYEAIFEKPENQDIIYSSLFIYELVWLLEDVKLDEKVCKYIADVYFKRNTNKELIPEKKLLNEVLEQKMFQAKLRDRNIIRIIVAVVHSFILLLPFVRDWNVILQGGFGEVETVIRIVLLTTMVIFTIVAFSLAAGYVYMNWRESICLRVSIVIWLLLTCMYGMDFYFARGLLVRDLLLHMIFPGIVLGRYIINKYFAKRQTAN